MNLNEKLEVLRDLFHGPTKDDNFFKRMDVYYQSYSQSKNFAQEELDYIKYFMGDYFPGVILAETRYSDLNFDNNPDVLRYYRFSNDKEVCHIKGYIPEKGYYHYTDTFNVFTASKDILENGKDYMVAKIIDVTMNKDPYNIRYRYFKPGKEPTWVEKIIMANITQSVPSINR
jgi:hypothetical protein